MAIATTRRWADRPAPPVKHTIKMSVRAAYARLLFHTGLHALVSRLAPKRFVILAGHCVAPDAPAEWPEGRHLPADMKISSSRLRGMLGWFGKRYRLVTVAEGVRALEQGPLKENLVALSFDDGYRDNHSFLLPLLREAGAPATVYLESRPLDEGKLNWTHKLFWLLERTDLTTFVHAYGDEVGDDQSYHKSNQVVTEGTHPRPIYEVKRLLKYEADPARRDAAVDAVFRAEGGDEAQLCRELYMSWDQARELAQAGVELGGHTAGHAILSRIDPAEQRREVATCAESLRRELSGELGTFAYPFGRSWDFDAESKAAVDAAGFTAAVTMHAGANRPGGDRLALKRLAIADDAQMHLLAAEVCGGFELLRGLGLDLSE